MPYESCSVFVDAQVTVVRLARNSGPAAARNIGLRIAKQRGAALVCFLDADCVPQPEWLAAMQAAQQATPGIVCGRTMALDACSTIGECPAFWSSVSCRNAGRCSFDEALACMGLRGTGADAVAGRQGCV